MIKWPQMHIKIPINLSSFPSGLFLVVRSLCRRHFCPHSLAELDKENIWILVQSQWKCVIFGKTAVWVEGKGTEKSEAKNRLQIFFFCLQNRADFKGAKKKTQCDIGSIIFNSKQTSQEFFEWMPFFDPLWILFMIHSVLNWMEFCCFHLIIFKFVIKILEARHTTCHLRMFGCQWQEQQTSR